MSASEKAILAVAVGVAITISALAFFDAKPKGEAAGKVSVEDARAASSSQESEEAAELRNWVAFQDVVKCDGQDRYEVWAHYVKVGTFNTIQEARLARTNYALRMAGYVLDAKRHPEKYSSPETIPKPCGQKVE